jgi:hypothetical protein
MSDPHTPATAPGTDQRDLDRRAALGEHLGKEVWPAAREELVDTATENKAPDGVLADLRRLPGGRTFENLQEVAQALGLGTEQHRF